MTESNTDSAWLAPIGFSDEQSPELVIYCCDGRFGGAFESFIRERLGIQRCARLVVPGGPVCLAGEAPPFYEYENGAAAQFFFLIDALRIERVHLIAHDRCAFYIQKLNVPEPSLRARQIEDLRAIADRIRRERPQVAVDAWIAEVRGDTVAFLPGPTS